MQNLRPSLKIFLFFVSFGLLVLGIGATVAAWSAIESGSSAAASVTGVALVFCTLSITLLTLLVKSYLYNTWLRRNGVKVKGVIVAIRDRRDSHSYHGQPYVFDVEYSYSVEGDTVNAQRTVPGAVGSAWSVNDLVDIVCDPQDYKNNLLIY